jgi:hypothetical protein
MTPETFATYLGIGALCFVSALCIVTTYCGASEKLSRNKAVGIRTRGTLASDAGWRAGHRAAIPVMWLTVPASIAGGAVAALTDLGPDLVVRLTGAMFVAVVIAAAVVANRAARRAEKS